MAHKSAPGTLAPLMMDLYHRMTLLQQELEQKGVKMTWTIEWVANGANVTIKLRPDAPGALLIKR